MNKPDVAERLEAIFPKVRTRAQALELFTQGIRRAHEEPASWGTTAPEGKECIRLIVGLIEVITLYDGVVMLILDDAVLSPDAREAVQAASTQGIEQSRLRSMPTSIRCRVKVDHLQKVRPLIDTPLWSTIAVAYTSRRTCFHGRFHCDAVVEYLSDFAGAPLPQPAYAVTP